MQPCDAAPDATTPIRTTPSSRSRRIARPRTGRVFGIFTPERVGAAYANVHPIVLPTYVAPFTNQVAILGKLNVADVPEGWVAYMMCGIARCETRTDIALKVCMLCKPR